MKVRNTRSWMGTIALSLGGLLCVAPCLKAQPPVKTHLKKILVLDKSQFGSNGHRESRADLNKALAELAAEKGFAVTAIRQNDPASVVVSEFSPAQLATYQAVILSNNEGVDRQLDSASKINLEAYVKNGGGLVPIHAASAFISNWAWLTSVLVESFYSPSGSNQPTADLAHDSSGTRDGSETKGIFKGLTAPKAFMDAFISFRASPRGRPGVTILLTVDEKSYSKPIYGPMGDDHPVAWSKTEEKGRVAHISLGFSWSTNNVYTAKNSYLKYFLYGALRYVAGDFVGCTDSAYAEYNPDATKSDPAACKETAGIGVTRPYMMGAQDLISRDADKQTVRIDLRSAGTHSVTIMDVSGRVIETRKGVGANTYALPVPARSGIYTVVAKSGGEITRFRITVL